MNPLGPTIGDAILYLLPSAKFVVANEDIDSIEWREDVVSPPSKEEIIAALETLKNQALNDKYRQDRANAYPSIGDQLDALFHAGVFPEDMANKIQAVKDAFPKPPQD